MEFVKWSTATVKRKYPEAEGMDCALRMVIKYESTLNHQIDDSDKRNEALNY